MSRLQRHLHPGQQQRVGQTGTLLQAGITATAHTNTGTELNTEEQSSTIVRNTFNWPTVWWIVPYLAVVGLQKDKKTNRQAREFRFACEKAFEFRRWHIQSQHCNGTGPLQLKIAHNQSTGRHISVLLKRINVQCSGRINGWQDSKSIDMDMLFGITSTRPSPRT